ncbi:nucleotidyltransferase [Chitinophaga caeni]|uniref:Nucleotidyltransferase n=1 Tax=Chitinophaga caeni TaxID=2029983 RepID=A0A291QYQ1_9BACT|nr:DNA polymerase Y family protein [Chitinophaga caeni]ATL48993.1 nucleotidyltransferase [Chitinophaga caeni]
MERYLSIWFPRLLTDWKERHEPNLKGKAFVLAELERGRKVIRAVSAAAQPYGIRYGTVVADARAAYPSLLVYDYDPDQSLILLGNIAEWCIHYSPVVGVDSPDGLVLDISGCTHLWGGEIPYLEKITGKFKTTGYSVQGAIADTIGAAWAQARYGNSPFIIPPGRQREALLALPPAALRLEPGLLNRMRKLGFYQVGNFISIPRGTLRRRFGQQLLDRLAQALGEAREALTPVIPVAPYQEHLPSLEPIQSAAGIEIALQRLLETLCRRLFREGVGLRKAVLTVYRIDGKKQQLEIGTNRPSRHTAHLLKLFKLKTQAIAPGLGIELFVLEAPVVEELTQTTETLWKCHDPADEEAVADLLDRMAGRLGASAIRRYLPQEHYWPERATRPAASLSEPCTTGWRSHVPRPVCLLAVPLAIEVMVPLPDYPPIQFRYRGTWHKVKKADGPERIEQEWWMQQGDHRDYYCVEDEPGRRYWIFRLGLYGKDTPEWFLHGFFA